MSIKLLASRLSKSLTKCDEKLTVYRNDGFELMQENRPTNFIH